MSFNKNQSTAFIADETTLSEQLKSVGRVGVLYGGLSAEREVSLQSGSAIIEALKTLHLDVVALDVGDNAIEQIQLAKIDFAFIALHGGAGEDGRMQALLEYLQIPYTGSGVNACAHAMDKLRCKYLWRGMNLSTADFSLLNDESDWTGIIEDLGAVMVKPASEGSSIGMAPAKNAQELKVAYQMAKQFDPCVIAERLIYGAEYTVTVLGNEVMPPIRLETDNKFYDYDAKYVDEDTRYLVPCGLPPEKEDELKVLAAHAFNSLGCKDWGRVDVMADENGVFYVLEVNTVPGMTSHSLVPMAARAYGLSFEALVGNVLRNSYLESTAATGRSI